VDVIASGGEFNADQANALVIAAVTFYCPQHTS